MTDLLAFLRAVVAIWAKPQPRDGHTMRMIPGPRLANNYQAECSCGRWSGGGPVPYAAQRAWKSHAEGKS